MRERTHLDTGLKAIDDMERDLVDSIELIELGEMEDDTDVVADAEATIEVLHGKAQQAELQTLLSMPTIATWRSMPVPAARRPKIGPRCWAVCMYAGASLRVTR